ncbi:MAG TPA: enoyl-CoA hydratase-related protein [Trebonia sp.]|nr:enoyl-CoA hydratase-related protein [Trebonia sp.]
MSDTLVERSDGLVTVTFNRPRKKNALNAANWADLDAVLREVARNPADRALVLTGAEGDFSAGADLSGGQGAYGTGDAGSQDGPSGLTGQLRQPVVHEMRLVGEVARQLHRLPKPTLAVVDGVAVGVGLGLALACDLIIASDRARFSAIFVRRGLALDGGSSWTLPRAIGLRRAKQMAFFGEMVGAADALAWGLVNEVVPAGELRKAGQEWGHRLAAAPTTAISLIKRQLDDGPLLTFEQAVEAEAQVQHVTYTTSDVREGITAFVERRSPRFTGQ